MTTKESVTADYLENLVRRLRAGVDDDDCPTSLETEAANAIEKLIRTDVKKPWSRLPIKGRGE